MRSHLWLLAFGIAVIPVALLIVLAVAYLLQTFELLLAPNVPIRLTYATPTGPATFEARSFRVDPWQRTATLVQARLTDPRGIEVAQVGRVDAAYDEGVVRVSARDGRALIERLPDGRLSVELLVAERDDEPPTAIFEARLERVRITYLDRTKAPTLETIAFVPRVDVVGARESLSGAGSAQIQGVGWTEIAFRQADEGRWELSGRGELARAPQALAHLRRWLPPDQAKTTAGLEAQTLRLTVRGRVGQIGADRALLAQGSAEATGSGVTFPRYAERARVQARAWFQGDQMRLIAAMGESRRSARFDGRVAWSPKLSTQGAVQASARSSRDLWPDLRNLLPLELSFSDVRARGDLVAGTEGVRFAGPVEVARLAYDQERVATLQGHLRATEQGLSLRLDQARWRNTALTGALGLQFGRNPRLAGRFLAPNLNLRDLPLGASAPPLQGTATVDLLLAGTPSKPILYADAKGALATRHEARSIFLGLFDVRVRGNLDNFRIDRLALSGPNGVLAATGTAGLGNRPVDLTIDLGSVNLAALDPDLRGRIFGDFRVQGTLRKPKGVGTLVAFGIGTQDRTIPVLQGRIEADGEQIVARGVEAGLALAELTGEAAYRIETKSLQGSFKAVNLDLSTLAGDQALGLVQIETAELSGTLEAPRLALTARGSELSIAGVSIQTATARGVITGTQVALQEALLTLPSESDEPTGTVRITGAYGFDDGALFARANLNDVQLQDLPIEAAREELTGRVDGSVSVVGTRDNPLAASADLRLEDVIWSGEPFGQGLVRAGFDGRRWSGTAELMAANRSVVVQDFLFDQELETVRAEVSLVQIPARPFLALADHLGEDLSDEMRSNLQTLDAVVTTDLKVDGPLENLNFQAPRISADEIFFQGRSLGEFDAALRRENKVWTLESLSWLSRGAQLTGSGTLTEDGPIAIAGELANVPLSLAGEFAAGAPALAGSADVSFLVQGTTQKPELIGSLSANYFPDPDNPEDRVSLLLESLRVAEGKLVGQGKFFYGGFSGALTGQAPVGFWPDAPADPVPLEASLNLVERDLVSLPGLDPSRTQGRFGGSLTVRREQERLVLNGVVRTSPDAALGIAGFDTAFVGVNAEARLRDTVIELAARADSTLGGRIVATAQSDLARLTNRDETGPALSRIPLDGRVTFEDFTVQHFQDGGPGRLFTIVAGALQLSGTAERPVIGGELNLPSLDLAAPQFETAAEAEPPPINPRFNNIVFKVASGARLRASTASLTVEGSGSINGSLLAPEVVSRFVVEDGVYRLPTARVGLEEGGTLDFLYRGSGEREAITQLQVNLIGTTALSARRFGDFIERYEITLGIAGDLLQDGGVRLSARSDPPDLTQDQILALLGQKDLIEGLGRGGQSETQAALTRLALPFLANPVTEGIAGALKLDYFAIEYSPFNEQILSAAKTITRGLTVLIRRQVNEPQPGLKRKYELRLTYRIPVRNPVLSRVRIGFGFDQDRPWKVTFEYLNRF